VGVNQPQRGYWARIKQFYMENRKTTMYRTQSSLQHRWAIFRKIRLGFVASMLRLKGCIKVVRMRMTMYTTCLFNLLHQMYMHAAQMSEIYITKFSGEGCPIHVQVDCWITFQVPPLLVHPA
jgi:hypothetical protein